MSVGKHCPDCAERGALRDHAARRLIDQSAVGFPARLQVKILRLLCTDPDLYEEDLLSQLDKCRRGGEGHPPSGAASSSNARPQTGWGVSTTPNALGIDWDLVNQLALIACRLPVYADHMHLDRVDEQVWKHTHRASEEDSHVLRSWPNVV